MKILKYQDIKKKVNAPDLSLFYSYKVYPRELKFDYLKHRYYIYIYLNPFKSYIDNNELGYIEDPQLFFGYEPIYVGKGVSGHGYRFNQHISKFLKGQETNQKKKEKFKEIEKLMQSRNDGPKNWNDYKQNYIVIYKTFPNEKELLFYEMTLINKIGTLYSTENPGPLTNKITNFEMKKIKKRIEDELFNS